MLLYLLCLDTCGLFDVTSACGCYLRRVVWRGLVVVLLFWYCLLLLVVYACFVD